MTRYLRGFSHFVTSMTAPIASGWSNITGWDSHPLRNAAFARRTPQLALPGGNANGENAEPVAVHAQQSVFTLSAKPIIRQRQKTSPRGNDGLE